MRVKATVEVDKAAQTLKLLGDKTRLTMMKMLQSHDCCVCEFVAVFKTSQPAISQHLRKLRDAELVKETRKGQWIFYSINKESKYYEFVLGLLDYIPSQDDRIKELEQQGLRIMCD
ncbi:ArsR/SmtB family transcription factor [Bacillus songklensis]|uniref:ArsR/SmtB family transcription factor n=1 Tax=Bacillus songklensis TaxID=1069116 RepID=A0ABV8B8Z1_9BACI